jgi:tRNA G18 (ribose-2'-O)-methylase SpoU
MRQLNKKEVKAIIKETPKRTQEVVMLLENIQYARNVAGMFRTADAAGVRRLYLTGISQQPPFGKEMMQVSRGKEKSVEWKYERDTGKILNTLHKLGYYIVAVELTDTAKPITELPEMVKGKDKVCLILGNEVYGVTKTALEKAHDAVFVPMYGKGASLNVATTAGIVLYSF